MYIVTGAAGFIGSAIIYGLNTQMKTHNILAVDRLGSDERWKTLNFLQISDYQEVEDFLLNLEKLPRKEEIRGIFHMGACSSTTERNVSFLMKNNLEFSQTIFRFAAKYNVPLLYASSAATYGDGSKGYSDDHAKIPHYTPLNAYGFSKQLFDEWVLNQTRTPRKWVGLKFFNVYGPNEYHKASMMSVVNQAYHQIKNEGKVRLFKSHRPDYKDGEQMRDFISVKDVVGAMLFLLENMQPTQSGIYNLGTGKARSFKDLALATFKALQLTPDLEYFDMPETIRHQYQYFTEANMDKFLAVAQGNFAFTSLEDGVKDYVLNYLEQSNPYLKSKL